MNVVFAINRDFQQHLAVAIASLLENNSGMKIYVLHSDLSAGDWKKLRKLFKGKDSKLIEAKIDGRQTEDLVTPSYFSKAVYYKLFIQEIVKEDKVLYLDSDIVINGRIDDLYRTDISKTFLAAVDDMEEKNYHDLTMDPSAKYFNAGVMLINLECWRENHIKEKVIDLIRRKPEVIRFPEQDGLNSVINGNWLELHPRYNMHSIFYKYASNPIVKEAIENPVVIHYIGPSKPWHFRDGHPYKHLYWKYLRMTPYKYYIPDDIYFTGVLKMLVPAPVKRYIKKILGMTSPKNK